MYFDKRPLVYQQVKIEKEKCNMGHSHFVTHYRTRTLEYLYQDGVREVIGWDGLSTGAPVFVFADSQNRQYRGHEGGDGYMVYYNENAAPGERRVWFSQFHPGSNSVVVNEDDWVDTLPLIW